MREWMRAREGRAGAGLLAAAMLGTVLWSAPASAAGMDPAAQKQACISASESAQQLRMDGKLVEAQKQLVRCASEECPGAIRADCASWLNQVNALMPSVVLVARDAAGEDLADVTVTVDGQPLATKLDGKSLSVGPGEHVFRFEKSGAAPVEKRVILREGETARKIEVTIGGNAVTAGVSTPGASDAPKKSSGPGVLPWIIVGVGAATLVTGAVVLAVASVPPGCGSSICSNYFNDGAINNTPNSKVNDPSTGKPISCSVDPILDGCSQSSFNKQRQSDAGTARAFQIYGPVAIASGAAIVAGGLIYYFVARPSASERAGRMPWIAPFATGTTRGVALGGTF